MYLCVHAHMCVVVYVSVCGVRGVVRVCLYMYVVYVSVCARAHVCGVVCVSKCVVCGGVVWGVCVYLCVRAHVCVCACAGEEGVQGDWDAVSCPRPGAWSGREYKSCTQHPAPPLPLYCPQLPPPDHRAAHASGQLPIRHVFALLGPLSGRLLLHSARLGPACQAVGGRQQSRSWRRLHAFCLLSLRSDFATGAPGGQPCCCECGVLCGQDEGEASRMPAAKRIEKSAF